MITWTSNHAFEPTEAGSRRPAPGGRNGPDDLRVSESSAAQNALDGMRGGRRARTTQKNSRGGSQGRAQGCRDCTQSAAGAFNCATRCRFEFSRTSVSRIISANGIRDTDKASIRAGAWSVWDLARDHW